MDQQQNDTKLSVNCRDGPTTQRKCTDVCCCILYILIILATIFFATIANSQITMTPSQIQQKLFDQNQSNPLLAITQSTLHIIVSIAVAIAISLLLVILSFTIPALAVYIMIPIILLTMLLLSAAFFYRYFGNKLPFISSQIQTKYAQSHGIVSLIIGIAFLLAFVISVIVICLKQQRIKFIVAALRLAKLCFWQNCYMIIVSFILSAVSIVVLYLNLNMLEMSQVVKQDITHWGIPKLAISILVLFQMLWTHGFIQSYSDFIFQSFAIHWYSPIANYSRCSQNFVPSLIKSFFHLGTISFGWILAFIPETFNVLAHQMSQSCEGVYKFCCCCHYFIFQNLSKYSHIGTIMYSTNFCQSSRKVKEMREIAKHTFQQLYMIGNFYITLMKIFIIFSSIIICYFLIAQSPGHYATNIYHLIAPLIITLLGSLQIANHFLNATGLIGDTIYLAYTIDYNCQSIHFGNLNAQHCPKQAYQIIRQAKISKYASQ